MFTSIKWVVTITVVVTRRNIKSVAKRRSAARATITPNIAVLAATNTLTTRATAAVTAMEAAVTAAAVATESRGFIGKARKI